MNGGTSETGGGEGLLTFNLQFGIIKDQVKISSDNLTLKTLKDLACDFISKKVRNRLHSI